MLESRQDGAIIQLQASDYTTIVLISEANYTVMRQPCLDIEPHSLKSHGLDVIFSTSSFRSDGIDVILNIRSIKDHPKCRIETARDVEIASTNTVRELRELWAAIEHRLEPQRAWIQ